MEPPIKMDNLGGPPLFLETPICPIKNVRFSNVTLFLFRFGGRLAAA